MWLFLIKKFAYNILSHYNMSPHRLSIVQLVSLVRTLTKFEKISVKNCTEKFELQYLAIQHCSVTQKICNRRLWNLRSSRMWAVSLLSFKITPSMTNPWKQQLRNFVCLKDVDHLLSFQLSQLLNNGHFAVVELLTRIGMRCKISCSQHRITAPTQKSINYSKSKGSTTLKPWFALLNAAIAVILHGLLSS